MSYTFELCRALQRSNVLTLKNTTGEERRLSKFITDSDEGYNRFIRTFGAKAKITYKALRKEFSIPEGWKFDGLDYAQQNTEGEDFVRKSGKGCAYGSNLLRKVIGEEKWQHYSQEQPRVLDTAAFCLSFYEEIHPPDLLDLGEKGKSRGEHKDNIKSQLEIRQVPEDVRTLIMEDLDGEKPTLINFKGTASNSLKSCRTIIPHLAEGKVYSKACEDAGYTHTDMAFDLENVTNPVVKSVVIESMKQIIHLIHETGRIPGRIHVELGRDLGKSIDERNEMAKGINKRTKEKNASRQELAKELVQRLITTNY